MRVFHEDGLPHHLGSLNDFLLNCPDLSEMQRRAATAYSDLWRWRLASRDRWWTWLLTIAPEVAGSAWDELPGRVCDRIIRLCGEASAEATRRRSQP